MLSQHVNLITDVLNSIVAPVNTRSTAVLGNIEQLQEGVITATKVQIVLMLPGSISAI